MVKKINILLAIFVMINCIGCIYAEQDSKVYDDPEDNLENCKNIGVSNGKLIYYFTLQHTLRITHHPPTCVSLSYERNARKFQSIRPNYLLFILIDSSLNIVIGILSII
ncbi:uncharacterized protein LOC132946394 [Metopolophium dirhodum]|uniref:uncharacterized protein LOC132946394 n=1 Tax=Metopolophium dirhodum TaxID=44670 RepID=UPI0029903EB6|nr:uncharacterized protein LOC132946394 [Metopolophium dirhodum]